MKKIVGIIICCLSTLTLHGAQSAAQNSPSKAAVVKKGTNDASGQLSPNTMKVVAAFVFAKTKEEDTENTALDANGIPMPDKAAFQPGIYKTDLTPWAPKSQRTMHVVVRHPIRPLVLPDEDDE